MQQQLVSFFANPKKIRLWYICSFLLLIISLLLTTYVTTKLLDQSKEIADTDATINNLELTLSYTKDAETGLRGFIIMKDSAYLQPYVGSRERTDSVYNILTTLISDDPGQQQQMQVLKGLLNRRFNYIQSSLDSFVWRGKRLDDSTIVRRKSTGKKIMDSLRRQTDLMQKHEQSTMASRQAQMDLIYRVVMSINLGSLTMSVLLGFFAIYTFTKENNARKISDDKAADYRRRLELRVAELRSANAELLALRSNEKFTSTGRIARTIAHEVRNPLTNINLAVEQLTEDTAHIPGADMMMSIIRRNSLRIQQLIADLLNSTRFAELHFEDIFINHLLDQTLLQAQDRIDFQHIQVVKEYSKEMQSISVDGEKLKVAFLNIIVNAIEAMQANVGVLTIRTLADEKNQYVIVTDNGSGMSKETIQRLFEPYFTQKPKGTGLGMTNTQNIILNHKGILEVESVEGAGSTFTIRLPYTYIS